MDQVLALEQSLEMTKFSVNGVDGQDRDNRSDRCWWKFRGRVRGRACGSHWNRDVAFDGDGIGNATFNVDRVGDGHLLDHSAHNRNMLNYLHRFFYFDGADDGHLFDYLDCTNDGDFLDNLNWFNDVHLLLDDTGFGDQQRGG